MKFKGADELSWNNVIFTSTVLCLFGITVSIALFIQSHNLKNEWNREEEKAIKMNEKIIASSNDDILKIALNNLAELKEYYTISKVQARKAFSSARTFSSLGFAVLVIGIIFSVFNGNNNIAFYSAIGSVINNAIAALFFWLYNQSIKQLNLYHNSLRNLEKYLTATSIVDKISTDKKDDILIDIIKAMLKSKE